MLSTATIPSLSLIPALIAAKSLGRIGVANST